MEHIKYQYFINIIRRPLFSILASGILLSLTFPKPHIFYLAWIALIPLFNLSFRESNKKKIFLYYTISGWVFHSLTLNWLIANTFWVGFPAFIGYQILCLGLSIFWGIYGWLIKNTEDKKPIITLLIPPALWVGMEYLHSTLFTGFGWCNLGYSQGPDKILAQIASVGTVPLISFFIVGVNYSISYSLFSQKHRITGLTYGFIFLSLPHIIGWILLSNISAQSHVDKLKIAILQPNFSQEIKFDPFWHQEMVRLTGEFTKVLIKDETIDLIFWPEALIMCDYKEPIITKILQNITTNYNSYLITGSTRLDENGNDFNSCLLISPKGEVVEFYDKVHLAPFGEYLPLSNILPFLRSILPYDVSAGKEQKIFKIKDNVKIGPLICFEVLFSPLALNLKSLGANIIAVMTNLAWFGETNAIEQELEISRMRAIETRLPLVHCTNTGISGFFLPTGEFFSAQTLIGKGKTLKYPPLAIQPQMGIRTRLGEIFEVPIVPNSPNQINSHIDKVPALLGISGLILLSIMCFPIKTTQNFN
ncbi:MAG: apolipoprotein N-acyltransferase [Candidatus Hydrogenedentes bacterium]|nr:apolipoprotein N-acyltransferase [Candidatus Hydrogenedentota bacterium]